MDKVFIKDLRIRAIIGILDWERQTPQDIVINLTVYTEKRPALARDEIGICVDYSDLTKEVRALVEAARRYTVEALAEDIASLCLSKPQVRNVTVRVEKPGAVPEAASAGVEIERP